MRINRQKIWTAFKVLIFLIGLLIFCYPLISRLYYDMKTTEVIADFEEGKEGLPPTESENRLALARAYNASLDGAHELRDPYGPTAEEGRKNYAHMLEVREKIGILTVPAIHCREPVYAGTSEDVLQRGIGHMEGTSLPIGGESSHAVLTGHRGLPEAKLFTDLNKLKEGDVFYFENIKETLAYQVDHISIIEPSQFEELYIKQGEDLCTLLTCHPYMINSHRLLVRGHRIPYVPHVEDAFDRERPLYQWLIAALIIGLLVAFIRRWRKRRKGKSA